MNVRLIEKNEPWINIVTNGELSWQRKLIRERKILRKKALIADWRDPDEDGEVSMKPEEARTFSWLEINLPWCYDCFKNSVSKRGKLAKSANRLEREDRISLFQGFMLSFFCQTWKEAEVIAEVIDSERSRQMERRDKSLSGSSLHYAKSGAESLASERNLTFLFDNFHLSRA